MKRYATWAALLAGVTQEEFAERLSRKAGYRIRQGTVSKWARGETMPRPQIALLIESEFGLSVKSQAQARARKVAA